MREQIRQHREGFGLQRLHPILAVQLTAIQVQCEGSKDHAHTVISYPGTRREDREALGQRPIMESLAKHHAAIMHEDTGGSRVVKYIGKPPHPEAPPAFV